MSRSRRDMGLLLGLMLISWLVRALALEWASPLRPAFDEKAYFHRAQAVAHLEQATLAGMALDPLDLQRLYSDGTWPPLFPAVIGTVMAALGTGEAVARWAVLWISVLTTPVIFWVTRRLADRRSALAAAAIHAFYPSFVAYAHLLWSETLYILLLFLSIALALATRNASGTRTQILAAIACGATLGLTGLTRAAGLVPLLWVPGWLLMGGATRRWVPAVLALAMAIATLAPWEWVLLRAEGQPIVLSTASGYNLLKLNADFPSKVAVRNAIAQRAQSDGVHPSRAGRDLALEAIAADPARFLQRSWLRARQVWAPDDFLIRHLLHVYYPALSTPAIYAVATALGLGLLGLLTLAALGVTSSVVQRSDQTLLLGLVALSFVGPLVSIGNARMGLPLLALLVPLAGVGAAHLRAPRSLRARFAILAVPVAALLSIVTLPAARAAAGLRSGYVSSHYRELHDPTGWLRAPGSATLDCLKLRREDSRPGQLLELRLPDNGYRFHGDSQPTLQWDTAQDRSRVLDVTSEAPTGPVVLEITSPGPEPQVRLEPIDPGHLRVWRSTGLEGIQVRWCGVRASHQGREF
ncbi:glycosyltransferase family 39 protein [Myxococcota bacterium]|nr:glycosyltransferase family 39 protein [Myxococcota bacterium]